MFRMFRERVLYLYTAPVALAFVLVSVGVAPVLLAESTLSSSWLLFVVVAVLNGDS